MARYIDADALINYLYDYQDCEIDIPKEIAEFPSADVRENVWGKWLHKSKQLAALNTAWWYECSICGYHAFNGMCTDYCPNCGADMRGDNHDK